MDYYLIGGELYHHKYVKRERVNGQWRYWYPDDLKTINAREKLDVTRAAKEAEKKAALEQERARQKKALEELMTPTEATKQLVKSGVFDDMHDDDLDDVIDELTTTVYPKMSVREFRSLTREQKQVLACLVYISRAKESGVDVVKYAKTDAVDRKKKRKQMEDDERKRMGEALAHYGVKGQKWRQRRYQNKDGSLTPLGRVHYGKNKTSDGSKDPVATKPKVTAKTDSQVESKPKTATESETKTEPEQTSHKLKPVKKMTETELRERITRLELEKSYRKAKKESMSRGKAFVMDVLEQSGKNIAVQLTTYAMGTGVNAIAKASGYTNATRKTKKDDGTEIIEKIFEDIVNPRKGQKEK